MECKALTRKVACDAPTAGNGAPCSAAIPPGPAPTSAFPPAPGLCGRRAAPALALSPGGHAHAVRVDITTATGPPASASHGAGYSQHCHWHGAFSFLLYHAHGEESSCQSCPHRGPHLPQQGHPLYRSIATTPVSGALFSPALRLVRPIHKIRVFLYSSPIAIRGSP